MIERALILAAGRGTRLRPQSDSMPKPLTEVRGRPILLNALDCLEAVGVRETCIVAGYLHEKISAACGTRRGRMDISYVLNADYACTNNAWSLWLARDFLRGGCLLLEGDVFFDLAVLEKLAAEAGSAWAADVFTPAMNGCRLVAEPGGRIVRLEIVERSPAVPPNTWKSAGMLRLDDPLAGRFCDWLGDAVERDRNLFFDLVLGAHLAEAGIRVCSVRGLRWAEIDDLDDLAAAERLFA